MIRYRLCVVFLFPHSRSAVDSNCTACHKSLHCGGGINSINICSVYASNCSECVLEGSMEKNELVELNVTLATLFCSSHTLRSRCLRMEACKVARHNLSAVTFARAESTVCTNRTQALLTMCRQTDDMSETMEEECINLCDQWRKDKGQELSDAECNRVELRFCRRPGRGRKCTNRCRKRPRGSCVSQLTNCYPHLDIVT